MIQPPRSPQLMQLVATLPRALWSVERLSLGYRGPAVKVRRADAVEQDCYSQADIKAFCTTQNGHCAVLYDQSGNGYHASFYSGAADYPKVYDGATQQLLKFGRTPLLNFTTTNKLYVNSGLGFPTGSPALTSFQLTGAIDEAGHGFAFGAGNTSNQQWTSSSYNAGPPRLYISFGGPFLRLTSVVAQATVPSAAVFLKAAGATMLQTRGRQNKQELVIHSSGDGPQQLAGGAHMINAHQTGFSVGSCTLAAMGHWNALLAGQDLDGLEQVLERMRIQ